MAFHKLSTEILNEIIECVELNELTPLCLSLASCCRSLNLVATPILYQSFFETGPTSVPKFLRTILESPRLATFVKRYKGNGIDEEELLDVSEFTKADFEACQVAMKKIGNESQVSDDWMSEIREGQWHALTGFLLLQLPNIEDIEMWEYREDNTNYMDHALGIPARLQASGSLTQFSFKKLTNIYICPYSPNQYTHQRLGLAMLIPFCRIKSVKSMEVFEMGIYGFAGWDRYPVVTQDFATEELLLIDAQIDGYALTQFLPRFTSLRKFTYEHGAYPDFLPQYIARAIAHLKPCLEELEISEHTKDNGTDIAPMEIGSLADFEKLKMVDLDCSTLLGFPNNTDGSYPDLRLCQILPGSLESLTLRDVDRGVNLRELLAFRETKFPRLRKISMKGYEKYDMDPNSLKKSFKLQGVELLF